jgi:hypothetical protein
MDDGAGESAALASEKAGMADGAGTGKAAGNSADSLLDVAKENSGWLGLLALLLAIALIAMNFRQAALASERKRQEQEWQDAKDRKDTVVDLRALNRDLDAAA